MKDFIPPPSSDGPVPPSETHFVLDTAPAEDGEPQLQSPARRIIPPIPNSFRFYSLFYEDGIRDYWGVNYSDEPDEPGTEIPVESFGAAVLAGYGWSQGKGIGRNNKEGDIKVYQYERRSYKAGLGYFPSPNTGMSASSNDLNNTGGK